MWEKEFLRDVVSKYVDSNWLLWRNDCIERNLDNSKVLLYSIDNTSNIFNTGKRADDMRYFGRWTAGLISNDVIACGTRPNWLSLDIGLKEVNKEEMGSFLSGVKDVCKQYDMMYEGWNLNSWNCVSGMSYWIINKDKVIRRKWAKNKDKILVTADIWLGWAYKMWIEKNILSDDDYIKANDYKKEPWVNLEAFSEIFDMNVINSGMDITDGIIEFAYEILEQDKLGVIFEKIEMNKTVINIANRLSVPNECFMFDPGYDTPFMHAWTISEKNIKKVEKVLLKHGIIYKIIWEVSNLKQGVYFNKWQSLIELDRYFDDVITDKSNLENWENLVVKKFIKHWVK